MKNLFFIFSIIFSINSYHVSAQQTTKKESLYLRIAPGIGHTAINKSFFFGPSIKSSINFQQGNQHWSWSFDIGKKRDGQLSFFGDVNKIEYFDIGMHRVVASTKNNSRWNSSLQVGLSVTSVKITKYDSHCEVYYNSFRGLGADCDPETRTSSQIHLGLPLSYYVDFNINPSVSMTFGCHGAIYSHGGHSLGISLGFGLGRVLSYRAR